MIQQTIICVLFAACGAATGQSDDVPDAVGLGGFKPSLKAVGDDIVIDSIDVNIRLRESGTS
jgi:hypothetical protein